MALRVGRNRAAAFVAGHGLFDPDAPGDPAATGLKRVVADTLGPDFLQEEIAHVSEEVRAHALDVSDPGIEPPRPGHFPVVGTIAAERLQERLLLREALHSLEEARGLAVDAIIAPDTRGLSTRERAQLEHFSRDLEATVVRLLRSPRPDRGAPFLLTLARCQLVHRSLAAGQWVFLKAKPQGTVILDEEEVRRHHDLLEALAVQAGDAWSRTRASMPAHDAIAEAHYARLAESASRYAAVRDAAAKGVALHSLGAGRLIPLPEGPVETPEMHLDPVRLEEARVLSGGHRDRYAKALHLVYGYDLVRHNCTTELLGAIQSAFPNAAATEAALGATLDPGEGLSFIPAELFRHVKEQWTVSESLELPSYRKEKIAALAADAPRDGVRLRESNTLTTTVYPGSIHDDAFLFFADGKRFLRPFQGIANLGYGLAHSAAGAVALPADGGRRAWAGLRGIFYSVPELVGISIRKGRYDILPVDTQEDPAAESGNAVVPMTPQAR